MRLLIPAAAALALFAVQVQAQTTPSTTPAPAAPAASDTTAPAPATTPATPMKKSVSHRKTLQQRFDAANTTHDGHLTKDQATAANWPYVANNFTAIDAEKKGYVTVQDIHTFAKARRAAHQKPATTTPKPATNG